MAGNLTFSAMESDVWRRHGLQDNHSHLPRQGKRESFLFKKNGSVGSAHHGQPYRQCQHRQ